MDMAQGASKQRRTEESTTSAAPNLYLQIDEQAVDGNFNYLWYKVDLQSGKALMLNWQFEYLSYPIAVVLKSEIYFLGGARTNPEPAGPAIYITDVHRINTAVTPALSRFESAPSMRSKQSDQYGPIVAVVGDKIIIFNSNSSLSHQFPHIMEIFDRSSDRWFRFSAEDVHLPRQMEGSYVYSIVSDQQNNRILMDFKEGKGLYAFYPESFKWESVKGGKHLPETFITIVVNEVLYFLVRREDEIELRFIKYELVAVDLADGCKPLKIVWPSEFDHQFFRKSTWMDAVDLGNGKVCLVSQFHEHLDVPSDYDSDEYYYSGDEFNEEDGREKKKYIPVITCLVLEVEKQPPPPQPNSRRLHRRAKLLVKIVSRLDLKLEDLIFTNADQHFRYIIVNALVVPK